MTYREASAMLRRCLESEIEREMERARVDNRVPGVFSFYRPIAITRRSPRVRDSRIACDRKPESGEME